MKTIVTGGAGFIGSALCRHLFHNTDSDVVVVDKLTYAASLASLAELENSPRFRLVKMDICDAAGMAALFNEVKPDAVYHLAAESHVDRSISSAGEFVTTNVVGTFSVLEAARGYWDALSGARKDAFRILHVSTDEVYGSLGPTGLFHEDTPYDPSSPYSASKAASDHLAKAWARTYELPVVVSNCSNNYGSHQFPEKLIPLMILNALEGKRLPVYGKGENVRDWLHVDDHARALQLILEKGRIGETYNVGGRNERTNMQVVNAICELMDEFRPGAGPHSELIEFVTDRPGHDMRYAIDATKLETELGWRAEETFETGIRKTVEWYLNTPQWWEPLRSEVYSGDRLGLKKVAGAAP